MSTSQAERDDVARCAADDVKAGATFLQAARKYGLRLAAVARGVRKHHPRLIPWSLAEAEQGEATERAEH